jgi:pimeloyl-ACP methyl ester carboxylesterase
VRARRRRLWPVGAAAVTALIAALAGGAAVAAGSAAAATAAGAASAPTPPAGDRLFSDSELEAQYATPPSRFVTVDGVRIHLRDEGPRDASPSGKSDRPPLILLNGHLGSLQMWDPWMPTLTQRFRVIRIDYAPYGLSGPIPSGRYSTREAADRVVALANQLGLRRFHLGGTSNGALVALFTAIEHPDRVDRLVVSTLPAGRPPPRQPSPEFAAVAPELRRLAPVQPRAFFAAFLRDIIANDAVIDDALIDRYWKLNNRAGAKAWVDAYIQDQYRLWDTLDVKAYYARLARPMLIQWGADGVVLPRRIGDEVAALFRPGVAELRQYANAGHLPMIEQPAATVADAIAFLEAR